MAEYMPTIPAHGRQKQYVVQAGLHIQLKLQPPPPKKVQTNQKRNFEKLLKKSNGEKYSNRTMS